ncbi:MAG TPA: PKD domain-containing protein [Ohtaekwangia sp.]
MRTFSFIVIVLGVILLSCEKDIHPTAAFTIDFATDYGAIVTPPSDTVNIPKFATYEPVQFDSYSTNVKKIFWSFGDGQVTNESDPVISYPRGGEYTVTLSVLSETGNRLDISQPIRIYERVIEEISVNFQGWNYNLDSLGDWASDHVSDVVVEIGISDDADELLPGAVVYTDTIPDVSVESPLFSITPEEDVVLDYGLFQESEPRFYVITMYALDDDGKHPFYSSLHDDVTHYLDYETGLFMLKSGSTIEIKCIFK